MKIEKNSRRLSNERKVLLCAFRRKKKRKSLNKKDDTLFISMYLKIVISEYEGDRLDQVDLF